MDNQKSPLELHPSLKAKYENARGGGIHVSREPLEKREDLEEKYKFDLKRHKENPSLCGVCTSKNTELIYVGSDGSVAGGTGWSNYHCPDCGNYTQYWQDWG